jgi:signal transduction histidine kinase
LSVDTSALEKSASTLTPILEWDAPDSHRHAVQFYEDDRFMVDGLARFVGSALGAGDSAVVIATGPHREALAARLKARGLDVDGAGRDGRYIALDAAETLARFLVDDVPDSERFFEVVGDLVSRAAAAACGEPPQVAAFGEMVALLWASGRRDAALQLERLWNRLGSMRSFTLHCAYPISFFPEAADAEPMAKICAEHASVKPAESYAALAGEDERLRLIAQLQQKAQALEVEIDRRKDFDRQKDAFLSAAAHDLRTPLTSIHGLVQMLARRLSRVELPEADQAKDTLDAIQCGTKKMAGLIDELLDVSRLETLGTLALNRHEVDLVDVVRCVVLEQGLLSHKSPVRLTSTVEHLVGSWDRGRLERALTNVVSNALKYSPAGGDIDVTIDHDESDGQRCAIVKVADHGIGVPAADQERIFERFQRAGNVAGQLPGNGIGLSYVRDVVLQHAGAVSVHSQEGAGTTIILRLPIEAPQSPESS